MVDHLAPVDSIAMLKAYCKANLAQLEREACDAGGKDGIVIAKLDGDICTLSYLSVEDFLHAAPDWPADLTEALRSPESTDSLTVVYASHVSYGIFRIVRMATGVACNAPGGSA